MKIMKKIRKLKAKMFKYKKIINDINTNNNSINNNKNTNININQNIKIHKMSPLSGMRIISINLILSLKCYAWIDDTFSNFSLDSRVKWRIINNNIN